MAGIHQGRMRGEEGDLSMSYLLIFVAGAAFGFLCLAVEMFLRPKYAIRRLQELINMLEKVSSHG